MRLVTITWRSCRLRCPRCGQGNVFRRWFSMNADCDVCGAKFQREDGFFLGSIYVNYGLTALIIAVAYPLLMFSGLVSQPVLLGVATAFALLFPVWFFRYARSIWLGFDQYFDPREGEWAAGQMAPAANPDTSAAGAPAIEKPSAGNASPR